MDASVYKKRYDPELGRYVKKNIYTDEINEIYGSGIMDFIKKGTKKAANWGLKKVGRKAGEKLGEKFGEEVGEKFTNKKAGDKITRLLGRNEPSYYQEKLDQEPMTQDEIDERVLRIMSGGRIRGMRGMRRWN